MPSSKSPRPRPGVADYFTMAGTETRIEYPDVDLSSGGALVLPDVTDNNDKFHQLALGAGKDSNIYVVNRDNHGKFTSNTDNIYQETRRRFAQRHLGDAGLL